MAQGRNICLAQKSKLGGDGKQFGTLRLFVLGRLLIGCWSSFFDERLSALLNGSDCYESPLRWKTSDQYGRTIIFVIRLDWIRIII